MIKICEAFLVLIIFISILTNCEKTDTVNTVINESILTEETSNDLKEKTNAEIISEKYSNENFEGTEIRFLSLSPGEFPYSGSGNPLENELYFESESGDVLFDSLIV